MASKTIIAICMSGGEFVTDKDDGSLSYSGGDAFAVDLDQDTKLNDLKEELAETFKCPVNRMLIKYFLPGKSNKRTLITISKDKDLKRLVNIFEDKDQVEVFVMAEEVVPAQNVVQPQNVDQPQKASKTPPRRSRPKRKTVAEEVFLPAAPDSIILTNDPLPIVTEVVHSAAPVTVIHTNDPMDIEVRNETIHGGGSLVSHVSHDDRHRKAGMEWANAITGVGQRFCSFTEFVEALRKYSMAHGFSYIYKKKDSHRVTVLCKSEECPWRINASRLPTTQLIFIKKMNPSHTCDGTAFKASYRATREWVESTIKDKLKAFPNYKPRDIANDIEREYGIQLSYSRARRAKESARERLQGSYKEAYMQLPFFCEKIMETNPGSVATFITKEDSSFRGLFISFHASLSGFQQGCRPLLFLNSTPINSKYQGMLLAATAADGDDGVFPVAFAVVDVETDDNWRWFLSELKSAVSTSRHITFVADFQKGLRESLHDIFAEYCYHGYCLHYLTEKFNKDLKGQLSYDARHLLVEDLYAAANASKLEAFEQITENIKSISPEAYNWIIRSEPGHWASVFLGGARYNHMTSDFGRLFYGWVSEANNLPIIQLVDVILGKIMELIYKRRVDFIQWVTRLTPSMEEKLKNETSKARSLQVLPSHGSIFKVRGESVDVVDIDHWDCSCKEWQLTGLPCCHAIAVFLCLGRSPYDYCSKYFTAESYRLAYADSIDPVPNVDRPAQNELDQVTVTPPKTKRPPGRPKMNPSGLAEMVRREVQCGKCKGFGHTKRSCKSLQNAMEHKTCFKTAELHAPDDIVY